MLFATPWTVAPQAPLSMKLPRQEYCSGLPFPPSGDLPDPGTELTSPESPALAGIFLTPGPPGTLTALESESNGLELSKIWELVTNTRPLFLPSAPWLRGILPGPGLQLLLEKFF